MFIARNLARRIQNYNNRLPVLQGIRFLSNEEPTKADGGGYAKAYEKFENIKDEKDKNTPQNFTSLLRNSRLIDVSFI